MIGAKDGKGGFFPKGIQGRINNPVGFDELAEAIEDWTGKAEAKQVRFWPVLCSSLDVVNAFKCLARLKLYFLQYMLKKRSLKPSASNP